MNAYQLSSINFDSNDLIHTVYTVRTAVEYCVSLEKVVKPIFLAESDEEAIQNISNYIYDIYLSHNDNFNGKVTDFIVSTRSTKIGKHGQIAPFFSNMTEVYLVKPQINDGN